MLKASPHIYLSIIPINNIFYSEDNICYEVLPLSILYLRKLRFRKFKVSFVNELSQTDIQVVLDLPLCEIYTDLIEVSGRMVVKEACRE